MSKSSLYDYIDAYILVKRTITVVKAGATSAVRETNRNNKQLILKACAPFTDFISEINNTQVNNAKDLDVA